MAGELGKASLDLEANLGSFERNLETAHGASDRLEHALDALAAVADVCQKALNDVKLDATHAAESRVSAEAILSGVRGISDESRMAARELDRVKLGSEQASETEAAGAVIDHELDNIHDKAEKTQRALDGVRLRLAGAFGHGGGGNRPGYGVGPFGAGYGRLGVVGTAIGLGALTAPAAAPAAVGLLASIPALATAGAGALGTLILAFKGVGKAIGGDKKAFDDLTPAAKKFVLTVRSLDGFFDKLRQRAASSVFPGLTTGLKAALSPGTVSAVEQAITAIGKAIGSVGAEFGRYFGSAKFQKIFGPLMASGARNIRVLGDAFLHLFDALGVVGRAAIPFVDWLNKAIDRGSKLADSWIRSKDASGELSKGMNIARTSLTLVAKLAGSLLNVIFALGRAMYPVARAVLPLLTRGLNALAGIIHRNQGAIREIALGALHILVNAVKIAAGAVGLFVRALRAIGGHKAEIIAAVAAIGVVIALTLGPEAAVIIGAIAAVSYIKDHWRTIVGFFKTLGKEILLGFEYLWYHIEKLALQAALKIVEPFSHLPGFLGGWARKAKNSMQHQLDKIRPPDMNWHDVAVAQGLETGKGWTKGFAAAVGAGVRSVGTDLFPSRFPSSSTDKHHHRRHRKGLKPGTHAWYIAHLGYDPTQMDTGSPFGKQPPFTKNTGGSGSGSHSVIPAAVANLDALAARQEQEAAALHYRGKKAREHLEREITDLQKADKILEEKLKHAHGRKHAELLNALTANEKKIAEARKRLHDATANAQQSRLDFALDQAKLAVEKAQEGSRAWDRAIAAEEKALRAEIRYWDKIAHDTKLSKEARDKALKKELAYQHELNSLLKQNSQAAVANEKQFLTTFNDIQNSFGSNADPMGSEQPSNGKTNTHLYDIKQEARQTNQHLAAMRRRRRHHASDAHHHAAMAVG